MVTTKAKLNPKVSSGWKPEEVKMMNAGHLLHLLPLERYSSAA